MHRLPARIAAVMMGTILAIMLWMGVTVLWLTGALDDQARMHSVAQVGNVVENLLSQVLKVTLDYAKWDAAEDAVNARDLTWFYENIGSSANIGEALQLSVLWGGPLDGNIGWTDDDIEEGRPGLLGAEAIGTVERDLRDVALGAYEGTSFFAWRGDALFALGASRIERLEAKPGAPPPRDEDLARVALGQRIDGEVLARLADDLVLRNLEVLRDLPTGRPMTTLPDGNGQPIAYLAWDAPRPGTTMMDRILPPVLLVLGLTIGLAALGTAVVRRGAHRLVLAERRSALAARTDSLTGLPNRTAFQEALAVAAAAGERAILFLDVNDFKRINDSIGHEAGDRMVAQLARRLARLGGEGRLIARIGGDEFAVLLSGPGAGPRAEAMAGEVERAMAEPFDLLGHRLRLSAAVGHAVQASDAMAGDVLLRQADLAMYEAKRRKDRGPVAFDALIEQSVQDASAIEEALRAALERGAGFSVAYQPIASPDRGLVRVEALARWSSPELGRIPPDRFIAVAERSGLIIRLGQVILGLILDDLAAHPELRVSINVSPLQLMAPTFVDDLLSDLARKGIDPARVEIELTESVVVDDPGLAAQRLRELHEAGFSTALDDFGTGYSSIGYLQQMRFDTLKIDRSFVSGFCESSERLALLNAMILLAHALGLRVTCEGVETEQELRMLRDLRCDLAQGHVLDGPLTIEALAARWLAPGTAAVA